MFSRLNKDNFAFGFGLAFLVSAAVYGLFILLSVPIKAMFDVFRVSQGTMMATGLSANLIVINYYLNHHKNRTAKGIMVLFLLGAAYVVYKFYLDQV